MFEVSLEGVGGLYSIFCFIAVVLNEDFGKRHLLTAKSSRVKSLSHTNSAYLKQRYQQHLKNRHLQVGVVMVELKEIY